MPIPEIDEKEHVLKTCTLKQAIEWIAFDRPPVPRVYEKIRLPLSFDEEEIQKREKEAEKYLNIMLSEGKIVATGIIRR